MLFEFSKEVYLFKTMFFKLLLMFTYINMNISLLLLLVSHKHF